MKQRKLTKFESYLIEVYNGNIHQREGLDFRKFNMLSTDLLAVANYVALTTSNNDLFLDLIELSDIYQCRSDIAHIEATTRTHRKAPNNVVRFAICQ